MDRTLAAWLAAVLLFVVVTAVALHSQTTDGGVSRYALVKDGIVRGPAEPTDGGTWIFREGSWKRLPGGPQ